MAKSTKKRAKVTNLTKKSKKTSKKQSRAAESVDCLFELHKLQGILLTQLRKEIR